ncbi:hypothetical protein [Leifsonia shinshuensis]
MRLGSLIHEAVLNVASGTTRAALFCLALACVVVGCAGAEIAVVADIGHRAAEFRDRGGSTLVYRMKNGINASVCDRLRSIPDVSAAGAVRQRSSGEVAVALPDQVIPTFDVSAGFGGYRALGAPSAASGVFIAEDLASTLGVAPGQSLALTSGASRIGAVFPYPADGRLSGYGYSILSPADASQPYDECWIEAWPVTDALLSVVPTVLVPGAASNLPPGQGPELKQLNASLGTRFDGAHAFESRITRFAPVVVAVVGVILGFISVTRRRLELAAARHAGVNVAGQTFQSVVESLAWSVTASLVALPLLGSFAVVQEPGDPMALWSVALWPVAASVPAVLIGTVSAVLGIRERHLFVYFKSR